MFDKVGLRWGAAILALTVASGAASGDEKPRPVDVCADFSLFPDNHKFPDKFTYAAFKFKKLGGTPFLIVNQSGKERGLQFPKEGVEVDLPAAVPVVEFNLGTFAGEVRIEALDAAGKIIHTQTVPPTNEFRPVTVKAPTGKVATLKFTQGGNEGNLATICVKLEVVP